MITAPPAIAEELNIHISSLGDRLASKIMIPSSNVEPESYLDSTETTFSVKVPTVDVVRILVLLFKLNKKKAAGLDNIPTKLLKMAGNIMAPSLTQIVLVSFQLCGNWPERLLFSRRRKRTTQTTIDQYLLFRQLQKFLKNYLRPALRVS